MDTKGFLNLTRALNEKEKLQIVDLILTKGKKSITDVKSELNLNFSTAHRYLNELENAGILTSEKTIEGGRQKKMYSVRKFKFTLDPISLSSLVGGDSIKTKKVKVKNLVLLMLMVK